MNDPLANAYLKILEEGVPSSEVKGTTTKPSDAPYGDKKNNIVKKVSPKSATENADGEMDDVEEAPAELTTHGSDGEAKKLKGESNNPFDALFNKILEEEEAFNFSTEDNSLEPDSSFDVNLDDDGLSEFDDETEENETEEVTLTLSRELAEKLHEVLMGVLENSEEETEETDEMGDEMSETEETDEIKEEAVEAEIVGHALVDTEKLNKGMNNPSNKVVSGAVPVTNKTAESPQTGKGCDGELKAHSTEPAVKKLQSKKQDVGGVNVGKTMFDNK
jgi:hypothetical protein